MPVMFSAEQQSDYVAWLDWSGYSGCWTTLQDRNFSV